MEKKEIWRSIVGLPLGYEVSSFGNVRINYGDHYKPLEIHHIKNKYAVVYAHGQTFKIHHIVAQAFIPNPDNKPIVNHKDGNSMNNHVDNLEWATYRENILSDWYKKKTTGKCVKCKETGIVYTTLTSAEAHLGIPKAAIEHSAKWDEICFGYHFEYVQNVEDESYVVFIPTPDIITYSTKLRSIEEFRALFDK